MLYRPTVRGLVLLALVSSSTVGCFAHSRGEQDWDENPVVSTGAGATILYPGQTAPTYYPATQSGGGVPAPPGVAPNTAPPPGPPQGSNASAPTTQVGPTGERRSGAVQPAGMPITMIGGAEQDIEGHLSWKQEPAWMKYLMLPFAIVAAPFKAIAGGEPEPGPEIPLTPPVGLGAPQPGAGPAPEPRADYETEMVNRLERELDQRNQAHEPEPSISSAPRNAGVSSAAGEAPTSIADELAALKRVPSRASGQGFHRAPETERPAQATNSVQAPSEMADGIVDRDQDGRVDEWIFRENGEIERVELDENGDRRPDRTLHYDLATHEIHQVEEDTNADGVADSWTDYEGGKVARRRNDGDYDGNVDTWSFYRDGLITRHEQDTNGDGFRDGIGIYEAGKLVREDRDRDGDGRIDAKIHYDAGENVTRREEDNNRDGLADVVSYYEAGRLARRELIRHDDPPETGTP